MCLRPSVDGLTHPACSKPLGLDGLITVVEYKGIIKKLLYQLKYAPYLTSLTTVIKNLSYEALIQDESFMYIKAQNPFLIPVPLHVKKERKRGYNQATLIARQIADSFDLSLENKVLIRSKHTKPQFKLSKEERKENIKDAFEVTAKGKEVINGATIFVVDDIATTCFTLRSCAKILKRNGAKKVYGLVFAKEY